MGNAAYDERRRLEHENKLLHEQKFNARMKREAVFDEVLDLFLASTKAFLSGRGAFVIGRGRDGTTEVTFEANPKP